MSLAPLIYNRLSIWFISRGYVLGLYLAEKGTRLSGIFDYPEAAKSHDSRIIRACLYLAGFFFFFHGSMKKFNQFSLKKKKKKKKVSKLISSV